MNGKDESIEKDIKKKKKDFYFNTKINLKALES